MATAFKTLVAVTVIRRDCLVTIVTSQAESRANPYCLCSSFQQRKAVYMIQTYGKRKKRIYELDIFRQYANLTRQTFPRDK